MSIVGFLGTGHIPSHMARKVARAGHVVIFSYRNEAVPEALVAVDPGISAV